MRSPAALPAGGTRCQIALDVATGIVVSSPEEGGRDDWFENEILTAGSPSPRAR